MTIAIRHHSYRVPEDDHPRSLIDGYRVTFLTDAEQRDLGRKAQAGDKAARDRLVLAFIPASRNVVRKCVPSQRFLAIKRHMPDIYAEAMIGVIDAVDHWRPDDKGSFSSAVFCWARARIYRWMKRYTKPTSGAKYDGSVAVQLDVTEWASMPRTPDDPALHLDAQRVMQLAEQELRHLPARERELVQARLLADEAPTLQELGDRWGVSRERVRQIEARVLPQFISALRAQCGVEVET